MRQCTKLIFYKCGKKNLKTNGIYEHKRVAYRKNKNQTRSLKAYMIL